MTILVGLYVFWLMFLIYASAINAGWTKLPLLPRVLFSPIGVIFLIVDVVVNLTLGTVLFLQLPSLQTLTLSKRMANNIATVTWRGRLSALIVNNLLLPFTKNY